MWKRIVVRGIATAAWTATTLNAVGLMPYPDQVDRVVVGIAVCATARLMFWCHQRPLGAAYDLGYEAGRRDQMRKANTRRAPIILDTGKRRAQERTTELPERRLTEV